MFFVPPTPRQMERDIRAIRDSVNEAGEVLSRARGLPA